MLNFDLWDDLLHRYVDRQGRVNYRAWKAEAITPLTEWLSEMEQVDLHTHPQPDEQLAFWINVYNAATIAQILQRYPLRSIQPKSFGIPNWIAFLGFFLRPVFSLQNQRYSLNRIEHQVLRPQFLEPRIHFALVCASIGCPLLRNEAYRPERVRPQLEEDALRFINNSEKVSYEGQTQTLYCSKIFKWYQADFLKVAPSIPHYITRYWQGKEPISAARAIAYLKYDWQLNEQFRP